MTPARRRGGARSTEHPPALKRLGQHFLTDPRILERIAGALELRGTETVVEIGPGRGSLTAHLVASAGRVIAIEIDRALVPVLRERFAAESKVTVVEGDALRVSLAPPDEASFVVVGNVPYYITTPLIFHALEPPRPSRAVFLVQREVAERMAAAAGSGEYGALSVNVQALAEVEILFRVPPGAFQPPPKVDSAVIRLTPRAEPLVAAGEEEEFRSLVQRAFGFRRKQMRTIVRTLADVGATDAERILAVAGIEPTARPETLEPARFVALMRALQPPPVATAEVRQPNSR